MLISASNVATVRNQLIADAIEVHYLHCVPIGRISEHLDIRAGTLGEESRKL